MAGVKPYNPNPSPKRAAFFRKLEGREGVPEWKQKKVKEVKKAQWGKVGLLPEIPSMRRKRYEREIAERKKEIAELESNIRFWKSDQADTKAEQLKRHAEDKAAYEEIYADKENGWTMEEKKRRAGQIQHDYKVFEEEMKVQHHIMQGRIDEAEKKIVELKRKISQHEAWLEK